MQQGCLTARGCRDAPARHLLVVRRERVRRHCVDALLRAETNGTFLRSSFMTTAAHDLGISRTKLDAIELRLIGVDQRPWAFSPQWRAVCRDSRKARRAAIQNSGIQHGENAGKFDESVMRREMVLFSMENEATNDMGTFVANAPQDIEDLVAGVKFLQMRLEKAEQEREEFKKEMLRLRIETAELQQRHTEVRAAWRRLAEVMK